MRKHLLIIVSVFALALTPASIPVYATSELHTGCNEGAVQDFTPPRQIEMYLDGYHCYKRDMHLPHHRQVQVRTAHYCAHHSSGFYMCTIYDGNGKDARLIGIEYVIPDTVYKTLPSSEKKYWHPHDGEVDASLLVLPGLPEDKQKTILSVLRSTHGKTWQVWPNLKTKLPYGTPALLWAVDPKKLNATTQESLTKRKVNPAF